MINVLDNVKRAYKCVDELGRSVAATPKNYFIVFRDKGIMLTNHEITSESLSITESICSSGNFKVGLCESANCKISTALKDNVNGDEVCIFQTVGIFEPEITIDENKGLQLSSEDAIKLNTTFTSTNIISGIDANTFSKDSDYLVLAKLKYIGNPIYLYVENLSGNSKMVYYLKPGLFDFSNLQDWDSTKTYAENVVVKHNGYVWESLTYNNTTEPQDGVNSWVNITHYVQIAIPIIGNEFYEYKMGIYVNTDSEYGVLEGEATIYQMNVPLMPLGLFTISSCRRRNDNNIRDLEGYDRMQDVGLDVDVYFNSEGSNVARIGEILNDAADETQIVIGSNLSKGAIYPILVNEEIVPFDDFPTSTIYKDIKTETQTIQGDYVECNAAEIEAGNYDYSAKWYTTLRGTVCEVGSSLWNTYSSGPGARKIGIKRNTTTITRTRSVSWVYHPEVPGGELIDGEWYDTPGEVAWWEPKYSSWSGTNPGSGWVEVSQSNIYDIAWNDEGYPTRQAQQVVYRKDVEYGYVYPELTTNANRNWQIVREEYYTDVENKDGWYDDKGNPIKAYAYIDCERTSYYYYSLTVDVSESTHWILDSATQVTTSARKVAPLSDRSGEGYQNYNKIYSDEAIYSKEQRVYKRISTYTWTETAVLKKMTYAIPYDEYDSTISYTVYLTYPTDTLAYKGQQGIYELALQQIAYSRSDSGTYVSEGEMVINNQSEVLQAFLDNCTAVAEIIPGSYEDDQGITRSSGIFYVYWVYSLTYDCMFNYNNKQPVRNNDLSGVIYAANPYNGCDSHSKAEKFNSMPIVWGSETVHGTRRSIISGFLELHGLFINFDRYGVSTLRNVKSSTLYPALDLYPHDSSIPGKESFGDIYPTVGSNEIAPDSMCKSIYIDDDLNTDFQGIMISKSHVSPEEANLYPFYYNRLSRRHGSLPSGMPKIGYWEGNNYYIINNNFFFDNFIFTQEQLEEICDLILENIGNLQYFNMTAEIRCLPYMEVGDNINIMTPGTGYETAILRRTMKGNLAQMDSIETDFYS